MIEFHEIAEVAKQTDEESAYYEMYWLDGDPDHDKWHRTFIGFAHFMGPDQYRVRYVLDKEDTTNIEPDPCAVALWFADKHGVVQKMFHDTTVHGE
jgi:hypothetical protein